MTGSHLTWGFRGHKVLTATEDIADRPADRRFTVAGGEGMVEPDPDGDSATAWWTCKSAVLDVTVYRSENVKKRIEPATTLGKRVASVVGCPGPVPVRASG